MRRVHGRGLVCSLAIAALPATIAAQERVSSPACPLQAIGPAAVTEVLDGRTLLLTDRREVLLAGIETPEDSTAAAGAKSALRALVSGHPVELKQLLGLKRSGAERDRHGRVRAFVFTGTDTQPFQHVLLAAGHARVAALIGDKACAADLLRAEGEARAARLGVWANPHYLVRGADNPAAVLAEKGRFTLVDGWVLSVRESRGTIYVNFGRRWSEDFTVTVPKRSERTFTSAGMELKNLTGRRVRVRGTVEERGGPWIEVLHPEQIEIADRN